jgi:hypothetical protein
MLFGARQQNNSSDPSPTNDNPIGSTKLQRTINPQVVNAATALAKYAKDQRLLRQPRIVATYDYVDENGELLYQVLRYVPKDFGYRRKDSEGNWVYDLKDTRAVIYNLPAVLQANDVVIAEGEKDANSLIELGFTATTNHGGVGNDRWKPEFNDWFKDKNVLLIPDNDYPGQKHARTVATNTINVAGNVHFLLLPNLQEHGDISQWIARQRQEGMDDSAIRDKLQQLIDEQAVPAAQILAQPLEKPSSPPQPTLKWPGVFSPPKITAPIPMRPRLATGNVARASKNNTENDTEWEPAISQSPAHLRLARAEETWQPSVPLLQTNATRIARQQHNITRNVNEAPVDDILNNMLTRPGTSDNPLAFATKPVTDASFHDFAYYEYMLPPDGSMLPSGLDLTAIGSAEQDEIANFLRETADVIYQNVVLYFKPNGFVPSGSGSGDQVPANKSLRDEFISEKLFKEFFMLYTASDLYALYRSLDETRSATHEPTLPRDEAVHGTYPELLIRVYFYNWVRWAIGAHQPWYEYGELQSHNVFTAAVWLAAIGKIKDALLKDFPNPFEQSNPEYERYPFKPYPGRTVNFGLRINYRQTWNDLGTQQGPVVRTLPLGPSQSEKVSTRFVRNRTMSRSKESLVETERDRESTETTSDSSDVVREASESTNWYVEAAMSASGYGMSASVKAGGGGESSSSSKDAKSHLNETMEKTASRMRSETKAVISTSQEATFEETRATEITNPNEELAITYVYRQLLRQYRVTTEMAEVDSVIFVAEQVPKPSEITADWIRRHDSIIASVLLDRSLAEDLALIRSTTPEPQTSDAETAPINQMMDQATQSLGNYKDTGGTLPDIFRTPQEAYSKSVEQKLERNRREQQRLQREYRVIDHIKNNILHYCRAIWGSEDPDVRQQRYSEIMVPVNWQPVPSADGSQDRFQAVLQDQARDIRPLSEIINPAGPIGFACNYAIYYLKSTAAVVNLNSALSLFRSHYVLHRITIDPSPSNRSDARIMQLAITHVSYPEFELEFSYVANQPKLVMTSDAGQTVLDYGADNLGKPFDGFADPFGLRVVIDSESGNLPELGDKWSVTIEPTEYLEDPELRQLKWDVPLPALAREIDVFTDTVLAEMADLLPEVANRFRAEAIGQGLPEDTLLSWPELSGDTQIFIREHYHRYLLIRRYTKIIPVDSNNLLLDLELGKTPALEEFKRLHRYVDVLKAMEEQQQLDLENERRGKLLEEERLGDPDIEKVTVVGTASEVESMVNVDLNEDD